MVQTKTLGFQLLIMLMVLGSCKSSSDVAQRSRIQKRKYRKGYYIKMRTSNPSKKRVHEPAKTAQTKAGEKEKKASVLRKNGPKTRNTNAEKRQAAVIKKQNKRIKKAIKQGGTPSVIAHDEHFQDKPLKESMMQMAPIESELDPLAIASFCFAILGAFAGFITSPLWATIGSILLLSAIILGLISLLRSTRNPDEWRGKIMAWLGIALAALCLTILLVLLL